MREHATIGDYNTRTDWGMDLYDVDIGMPKIKTHYLDLPLESAVIDVSEAVTGRPSYGTRPLRLYLGKKDKFPHVWAEMTTKVASAIHGRRLPITLSFDPDYYYMGRIECETDKIDYRRSIYPITVTCDPYKYFWRPTQRTVTVDGTATINLENMDMITSPTFTTTASGITVSCNGVAARTILPGTDINIPEILLMPEKNQLTFMGSGTVKIKYQEGVL